MSFRSTASARLEVIRAWGRRHRPELIGAATFGAVAFRLAWMSDDGAITARVIANTLAGYGPNYNITERAQAFTHPLWFVVNTIWALVTRDIIITMLVVGVICATAAVYIVLQGRHWVVVFGVTALAASTFALTEYAGSGLENPLSWLLLAAMWRAGVTRRYLIMGLAAGLLMITRFDLVLVAGPFVLITLLRSELSWRARLRVIAVAGVPLLMWLLFSWVYYGSPVPETAYSKLNTAIPQRELLGQGIRYLFDLTRFDPIAAILIASAVGLAFTQRLSRESLLLVAGGIGLYGCYVIAIGGDFMTGRFWTVSIFVALIAVSDGLERLVEQVGVAGAAPIAAVTATAVLLPLLLAPPAGLPMFRDPFSPTSRAAEDLVVNDGIADEWAFYVGRARSQGLLQWVTQDPHNGGLEQMRAAAKQWPSDQVASRIDVRCGEVGRHALLSGPTVHWVVPCALSDPLLARMEFEAHDQHWRVGHYDRPIPPGYFDALASGLPDPLEPGLQPLFSSVSLQRRIAERWAGEVSHP